MKKSILVLFGLFFLMSFKETKRDEFNTFQHKKINETEFLVQEILDLPDLQWIYHSELKERLPVKILESQLIDKKLDLTKFGEKVRIMTRSELEREGIKDYVEFHKLENKSDTAEFELSYKIEGAGSSGKFIKDNEKWKILDYSVWEN